jgi:hypothetical protein
MAQRSPAEAERSMIEAAQNGLVNDAQIREMQADIDRDRATGSVRTDELAQAGYDDAQRFGAPALETFTDLASEAAALADELAHGLDPAEGQRRLDALLVRHGHATEQESRFQAAALAVVEIDEDPDAANEAFLAAHPDVRTDHRW